MRKTNYELWIGVPLLAAAFCGSPARAEASVDEVYGAGSLIVPMDTAFQDEGMFEAYGLVYELLRHGVPVDWTIASDKQWGGVDFNASAVDLSSGAPIEDHGYRGGPFVVDATHHDIALPLVRSWQEDHPTVAVHRANAPFVATVSRRMTVAPSIAVFVDGREEIAFEYLNAAAIPMSDGHPWPDKQDNNGLYACPGELCCADCLDAVETAGPTTGVHSDGALFDGNGTPRFCQFLSMHYKEPAGTPEVVAEVRAFLQYPVHFLAECEAVSAFENDPAGRFLTAGGLVAGNDSNAVDHYHSDDPFVQGAGPFAGGGGNVSAFSLAEGSHYFATNVVMVSAQGSGPGRDDIWMNGYVDADPTKGKVSYLGGHKFATRTPVSGHPATLGTRFFLNSLFEAPCSADDGRPSPSTSLVGAGGTNSALHEIDVCFENTGPGIAFDSTLELLLPADVTLVSAEGGGTASGDSVVWELGALPAEAGDCFSVTVSLPQEGSWAFASSLSYSVGLNSTRVDSGAPALVRYGSVNLLRYGGIVQLDPMLPDGTVVFRGPAPADPALDPARDVEVVAFAPGLSFPHDVSDLLHGAPPLVFYELAGEPGNGLRLAREGGRIRINY